MMYRLAAEGVLPRTPPMYRRLSAQLAQARREGRFPDLIDAVREVRVPPAWPDADAFVAEMPDWFRRDHSVGQGHALYVAAEKVTLRQQLTGWLEFAGIPVLVVCGFSSHAYADVVRDRVAQQWHGPYPGLRRQLRNIERDWVQRTGCWSSVTRVLLTYEQMRAYGLPATEGKRGDLRWPAFARRYGFDIEHQVQWEVWALEPDELRRLVLAAVAPYIDCDVLARLSRCAPASEQGWPLWSHSVEDDLVVLGEPSPESSFGLVHRLCRFDGVWCFQDQFPVLLARRSLPRPVNAIHPVPPVLAQGYEARAEA
ncbi:hypothetical protein ABZ891_31115 [Streptomyces sp. NPDC047023]|uniref:hypothetical protein n=1 Tax=Streptomyces sp. NPDC047023 TaxID=3155139 RepID=UPI0033F450F6